LFVLVVIDEERKFNKTDTWSRAQGSRLDWSLSSSSLRLTLEVVEDVEGDVVVENGVTVAVSADAGDAGDASSTAGTADLLSFYLFNQYYNVGIQINYIRRKLVALKSGDNS